MNGLKCNFPYIFSVIRRYKYATRSLQGTGRLLLQDHNDLTILDDDFVHPSQISFRILLYSLKRHFCY